MTTTFQDVAKVFAASFTQDNPRKVWTLNDAAPGWMRDAIFAAHWDGRLPDDWIYEQCRSLAYSITDYESAEAANDDLHDVCDGCVDIYTHDLTAWLASNNLNIGLCDEAVSEGLTSGEESTERRIQCAQYMALTYIYGALVFAIESQAAEIDDQFEQGALDPDEDKEAAAICGVSDE